MGGAVVGANMSVDGVELMAGVLIVNRYCICRLDQARLGSLYVWDLALQGQGIVLL